MLLDHEQVRGRLLAGGSPSTWSPGWHGVGARGDLAHPFALRAASTIPPPEMPWEDSCYPRSGTLRFAVVGALPGLFTVVVILFFLSGFSPGWCVDSSGGAGGAEGGRAVAPFRHGGAYAVDCRRTPCGCSAWFSATARICPVAEATRIQGVSVFIGLLVTIGSGGSVSQIMSGLILVYARALHGPADYSTDR